MTEQIAELDEADLKTIEAQAGDINVDLTIILRYIKPLCDTVRSLRAEVERLRRLEEQSNYQQTFTNTNVGDD